MSARRAWVAGGAVLAVAVAAIAAGSSCAATPPNNPIRSFEGAQKVAVVCLNVNDAAGNPLLSPPKPLSQDACEPVPSGVNGAMLPNHLYALVTQTVRGELAAVDLTAGVIVDEDRSTPGTNFIPVGTNPTDVTVAPDAAYSFVSSADPRAPAIYAIDNSRILGNSVNVTASPLLLTSLTACTLPQPPMALAVVSLPAAQADAGAEGGVEAGVPADGGDAGGAAGAPAASYAVVAMLAPSGESGEIVTIDPVRSGLIGGVPGALPPCVLDGSVTLSADLPPSFAPGPPWSDGVVYADSGILPDAEPALGPSCIPTPIAGPVGATGSGSDAAPPAATAAATADAGPEPDAARGDEEAGNEGGLPGTSAQSGSEGGLAPDDAGQDASFPLAFGLLGPPSPRFMAMRSDLPILYVADEAVPVVHVIDLSVPSAPRELAPLLATSVTQPTRQVQVGGLAISPPTRTYSVFLYAIDSGEGSLMVYDITDPTSSPHVPLTRPHPELNPFVPADRLTFAAPVATLAFVQHDWPIPPAALQGQNQGDNVHAATGFLCNPNPNAHPNASSFLDLGAWYRVDQASQIQTSGTALSFPGRLRGVFALATLSNGSIVTIDVDDWDAPCRRPDPMEVGKLTGVTDIPEPDAGDAGDFDPYHTPQAYNDNPTLTESPAVTLEPFFPVSAPHRVRSGVLLRNDPIGGDHIPSLVSPPILVDVNDNPVPSSTALELSPILQPTTLPAGFVDPTSVLNPTEPDPANVRYASVTGSLGDNNNLPTAGIQLSFDDPTVVAQNEDWTVTYEGVLASATSVQLNMASTVPPGSAGAYAQLTLTAYGQNLCSLGIEDSSIGGQRAAQALSAMTALGLPTPPDLAEWTGDYVEVTDGLPTQGDPYYSVEQPADDDCWGPQYTTPDARYNVCNEEFGANNANDNSFYLRDLPIVAAYSDHLVVGRFGWNGQVEDTTNRVIVANDPVNSPPLLKLLTCCFHRQAVFEVRAGGEWVAAGAGGTGFLHHVVTDPSTGACKLSCDPNDALLNSRSFDIPWGEASAGPQYTACNAPAHTGVAPAIGRNSVLAMRNPMFSYVTWSGCGALKGLPADGGAPGEVVGQHTLTARDLSWHFTVRAGFSPQSISLAASTSATVDPQSMLFIDALGQLAVVDGSEQGLVLIDLNSLAFAHAPYF